MSIHYILHPTFTMDFQRVSFLTHRLRTSQILPLPPEEAFIFFEDPRNLFGITPDWLDFRMRDADKHEVFKGAEFDYAIRWLKLTFRWRSRIVDYHPPERFTDIQIIGPYRFWRHLHTFEGVPEGTLMRDAVTYTLPRTAALLHRPIIRNQLADIFSYRSLKITEWATVRGTRETTSRG
jgi:ligand-binding SRPBCC domain-containing protein